MTWRVVQKGSGAVRPLVVLYHATAEADHLVRAALAPRACLVNETLAPFSGNYRSIGSGRITSLRDGVVKLNAELGAEGFWPIVLVGFSEGCQGIRTQLRARAVVTATLAVDGIHATKPPATEVQIDTWRNWFAQCGARFGASGLNAPVDVTAPLAWCTCSQIDPGSYFSVKRTLEMITGWTPLASGVVQESRIVRVPTATGERGVTVKIGKPMVYASGNLRIDSYPGNDAQTHSGQLLVALPALLGMLAGQLGFGGGGTDGPVRPVATLTTAPPGATGGVPSAKSFPWRRAGAAAIAASALAGALMLERGRLW